MYNIKEMVSDNKRAKFIYFKLNELWYETETGFKFPVPVDDTGDGIFNADEKAILLMRYIRKHVKMLEDAAREEAISSQRCNAFVASDEYCEKDKGHEGRCGFVPSQS